MTQQNQTTNIAKFNVKKLLWVSVGLIVTGLIGWLVASFTVTYEKYALIIGLVMATLGQLGVLIAKTEDVQKRPEVKDGFELYTETVKFWGTLVALLGAILAISA